MKKNSREVAKQPRPQRRRQQRHIRIRGPIPRQPEGQLQQFAGGGAAETESQEWMTREETRVWLNVSVRTVDNWMVDGTLPFYKRGAVVRFNRNECAVALKKFRHKSHWDTCAGDEEEDL